MKRGKRILAFALAVVFMVSSFANDGCIASAKKKTKKAVISVSIKNVDSPVLVLKKKSTFKLKTKVKVKGGAAKKVSFRSSRPKVASVSKKGVIKAKKKGTAKITVKSTFNQKKKAVLKVTVGTPVQKITLSNTNISMKAGEKAALNAVISPKKASRKKLRFTSSNEKAATVDNKGVVTAVAAGTAKITVKATDGSGKKADANITVTAAAKKPEETGKKPEGTDTNQNKGIVYTEQDLVWKDDFDGDTLNEKDWNYELHKPGWVNSELQEYVQSKDNVYVKDGELVIKAIKTENEKGEPYYTSGRINTKDKHAYKYGKFEAKVKVPEGKGFLPAFWMMPQDEMLYGQWPKCGEIDIMEVMGQNNKLAYGTIHYGEPHRESQGTYTLSEGDFTNDYHIFSCEWEPGKIQWFVDGIKYHEESNWYSTKEGQGTVTYPAPFDQPFYVILNLAVGGSWVTNPDENTNFDDAKFVVDYVKVYQKDESEYNENVKKPEEQVVLRDPDKNGNYINNGDFAVSEELGDESGWKFMTDQGGEAKAGIADGALKVETQAQGSVDYSVQLVQAGVPLQKGATYRLSFEAEAAKARTMKVAVKAPDYGYAEYMAAKTVDLTDSKQEYSYEFKMTNSSDGNARLEFNMGAAGSTEDIILRNVKLIKIKDPDPNEAEEKTVLADGNYVYNGAFQEGEGRLAYWEITNRAGAQISVTNTNTKRRLKVVSERAGTKAGDVQVGQSDLALKENTEYELSFDAEADAARNMEVMVAGQKFSAELSKEEKTFRFIVKTGAEVPQKNIVFYMGEKGTVYLDNVRLVENALIKNGSFDAGLAGYTPYIDASANASCVVDSLQEDNAADFTIFDTGDQDWKIQLKQKGVSLKEEQWYKLTMQIKSSMARDVIYAIQRDGELHDDDWQPYVQNTISLEGKEEYTTIEVPFQMKFQDDPDAVFAITMGAVDGKRIQEQHRICIDNISLEEIEAPEIEEKPAGEELIQNGTFADNGAGWSASITNPATGTSSFADNKAVFDITAVGDDEWQVQLKQEKITLEQNCRYRMSFKVTSTAARSIKWGLLEESTYAWYGGEVVALEAGKEKTVSCNIEVTEKTSTDIYMAISMGQLYEEGDKNKPTIDSKPSTITISDVSLIKLGTE